MEKQNILKLNQLLKKLGYVTRLPINPNEFADNKILNDWNKNKNLKAFSFYNKVENEKVIDVVIEHPLEFKKAYQRKITKT